MRLPEDELRALMASAKEGGELTVDLEAQQVTDPSGRVIAFEFDPFARHCLLNGLDDIARTLEHEGEIAAFESAHPSAFATTALP